MAHLQNQQYQFEKFMEQREPGELDLVQIVRDVLVTYGLEEKLRLYYDTDDFILQARPKRPEIQRYLLNSYLALQLQMSRKDSMKVRYGLMPTGSFEDWITIFKEYVAPFMADQDLPKRII